MTHIKVRFYEFVMVTVKCSSDQERERKKLIEFDQSHEMKLIGKNAHVSTVPQNVSERVETEKKNPPN